ncbi:MAG TPA: hypothetical protein VF017_00495 [Thermoanaerobaculia bacterium]|nr:hypothetical protein [Thermoanaerobaculia bacterium]
MSRALAVACLPLLGCVATAPPPAAPADPLLLSECVQTVPAIERQLWQGPPAADKSRLLFHLALCHALAESGVTDPAKAAHYFQQLAWSAPGSDLALAARAWLESHEILGRLASEQADRSTAATPTAGCPPEAGGEGSKADSSRSHTAEELRVCRQRLADREREIARLKKALDELIRLDIEKPPKPR